MVYNTNSNCTSINEMRMQGQMGLFGDMSLIEMHVWRWVASFNTKFFPKKLSLFGDCWDHLIILIDGRFFVESELANPKTI